MSDFPITHPPLTAEQMAAIAARHTSPAARLLLREIERLKVLEVHVASMLNRIETESHGQSTMLPIGSIRSVMAGRLPITMKFGVGAASG